MHFADRHEGAWIDGLGLSIGHDPGKRGPNLTTLTGGDMTMLLTMPQEHGFLGTKEMIIVGNDIVTHWGMLLMLLAIINLFLLVMTLMFLTMLIPMTIQVWFG